MHLRTSWAWCVVAVVGLTVARAMAQDAPDTPGREIFKATASIKTASGAAATAPVTITIDWKMPQSQADGLIDVFKKGGPDALRKALDGVSPTGSVRIGGAKPVAARMTIDRATSKGRLVTVVTLEPIVFIGAGVPNAKATDAYQFGVIDLEVDASGKGSGTLSPAAKITVHEGAFVIEDYASDLVELKEVSKVK